MTAKLISLNIHLVRVAEFGRKPTALLFQHESQFIEPFNQIIAERLPFITMELSDNG
jgi:hypothetical protein